MDKEKIISDISELLFNYIIKHETGERSQVIDIISKNLRNEEDVKKYMLYHALYKYNPIEEN